MAERSFVAPDGTCWQAWEVVPSDHADWSAAARRHLAAGLVDGWLCFESSAEKRRLHPIPAGWHARTDAELWRLCAAAAPVRRRPVPAPA